MIEKQVLSGGELVKRKRVKEMCEVCDKDIYFDSIIHHSDAGYGDDDWDDKFKNGVIGFICPACGKLKESAIKQFGSKEKALMYLMTLNMDDRELDAAYINQFKEILRVSKLNRFEKVLEKNGLRLENGKLVHSCGHVLLSGIKDINTDYSMVLKIEQILGEKSFKFCPNCGKSLIPLKKELDMTPSELLYVPL